MRTSHVARGTGAKKFSQPTAAGRILRRFDEIQEDQMDEARNTQVVKDAYAAFGRGDIPALLAMVDPGAEWTAVVGSRTPTAGTRHKREGVAKFFQDLAASISSRASSRANSSPRGTRSPSLVTTSAARSRQDDRSRPTG